VRCAPGAATRRDDPVRPAPPPSCESPVESMLLEEQLSRNAKFWGVEPQRGVQRAKVVVLGLGGVGSHAAHMLARAGVGSIRLVDFDMVRGI
jgi:tRNA A37 threonylcarbamoyladenosine dehydratase